MGIKYSRRISEIEGISDMYAGSCGEKGIKTNNLILGVEKFNREHKALAFLGVAYAFVAIFMYDLIFYFRINMKRFTCLVFILFFAVVSSSFAYPEESEVFVSDSEYSEPVEENTDDIGDTVEYDDNEVQVAQISGPMQLEPGKQSIIDDIIMDTVDEIVSAEPHFDREDWKIILVNKQHLIPDDYEFPLGVFSGSMRCDERVVEPLWNMISAARNEGVSLTVCSPYRDLDRQTMLFSNKVNMYMNTGMSYEEAYDTASQIITVPGSSEHQIGLAFDFITYNYTSLEEGFADTDAGKWLNENSYKFGFILRYPAGKEDITGIEYEPWHFRYVGVDAAKVMKENNICLEEFWSDFVNKE